MCKQTKLTDEQIYENKKNLISLLMRIDNENFDSVKIVEFLENINYFTAPVNAQTFRSFSGGLCSYALDLFNELYQLCNAYCPGRYTEEDIIKVAIFKDVYRAILYETYNKNVKNEETGAWESIIAYKTREDRPVYGDLGFSSYMLVKSMMSFTDEQIEAICMADANSYANDYHEICRQYPLVTITSMASKAAGYLFN